MKVLNYKGEQIYLEKSTYQNGRVALLMKDLQGLLYATLTINIPDENLLENQIIIKDYSENVGILKFLMNNNIVSLPIDFVQSGHIIAPIVYLFPEEEWKGEEYTTEEFNQLISSYTF